MHIYLKQNFPGCVEIPYMYQLCKSYWRKRMINSFVFKTSTPSTAAGCLKKELDGKLDYTTTTTTLTTTELNA